MNPRRGEIWLADLGLAAKTRPVVIVSREDLNRRGLSSCTCLSPPSRETVRMKCRFRAFRSSIVTQ
jgi:mRNA-degrading endonuclease toxin of MazEF toxin-antitoxin module